ncbi:MAG: alpha-1,2-fucosyltransferase, partial [Rickettsiales bacterium]|nr:alpha-1,2-fucosyltransferase [Rickettsiales bacterium]
IYILMGGLGNQMYMYAFGHISEKETGNKMLYDLTWFDYRISEHEFNVLKKFNIDLPIANYEDIYKVLTDNTLAIQQKAFGGKTIYLGGKKYTKRPKNITIMKNKYPNDNYKKIFRKAKFNNLILQTMPMNVEYLNKYRQELLEKFTLREKLDAKNQAMLDKIKSHKNSVSIHIRRGDYLKYNRFNVLDVNYYQEAMAKFAGMEDLHFFVFSNDIPWVKENIKFTAPHTFVDLNDELNGYKDMWLMKHCKHNIIANSTFSWWSAWLNENPDKIVVEPLCWTTNNCNKRKMVDPEDWEIIDNSAYVKMVNEQLASQNKK